MRYEQSGRLLEALEALLTIDVMPFEDALNQAAHILCASLQADKFDVFLYQSGTRTLEAMGVSDTPMGHRQRELGLDRLPIAAGGLAALVYRTGESVLAANVDADPRALASLSRDLGVRSVVMVPLDFKGRRRGVLQAASAREAFFHEQELEFLHSVARWVALLAERAELMEQVTAAAYEIGRDDAVDAMRDLLTARQLEVARLVAVGLTNKEIGEQLFLTPGSVANHIERIFERLGISKRTQIATWVARTYSVSPEAD
jgi:DNA-binding CsgD family transcriptional regulator